VLQGLNPDYERATGVDSLASLIWLTLGAFAIGTKGFMIAGLLPTLCPRPEGRCARRRSSGDCLLPRLCRRRAEGFASSMEDARASHPMPSFRA